MISINDCFQQAGIEQAAFETLVKDHTSWYRLIQKEQQHIIYLRWTAGDNPDPEGYAAVWPNNLDPQPLTDEERAEIATFEQKYKSEKQPPYRQSHWLVYNIIENLRRKLLKTTPAILHLVEADEAYLKENGWEWPLKVKKLIEQGYLLSEKRVRFTQDKTSIFRVGSHFRLSPSGMQHRIHRVIAVEDQHITYEPAGFTNYGYMLIKPPSKRPTRTTLEAFLQRNVKHLKVIAA
jgi:hypothetical protein